MKYYAPFTQIDLWQIDFYRDTSEYPVRTVYVRTKGQREAEIVGERLSRAFDYDPELVSVHHSQVSQHSFDNYYTMHRISNICYFTEAY